MLAPFGTLQIRPPRGDGWDFDLSRPETTVGSDPSNGLVLQGRGISIFHCKIVIHEQGCDVVDLDSSRGTLVNGTRYTSRRLMNGDQVTVGDHSIVYVAPEQMPYMEPDMAAERPVPALVFEPEEAPLPPAPQSLQEEAPPAPVHFPKVAPRPVLGRSTASSGPPSLRALMPPTMPPSLRPPMPSTRPPSEAGGPLSAGIGSGETEEESGQSRGYAPATWAPSVPFASFPSPDADSEVSLVPGDPPTEALGQTVPPSGLLDSTGALLPSSGALVRPGMPLRVPHLNIFDSYTPRQVPLDDRQPNILGTHESCSIVLPFGKRIFPKHASVTFSGGHWMLQKLFEPGDVIVNNAAVDQVELFGGEVLNLGDIRMEFRDPTRVQTGTLARPGGAHRRSFTLQNETITLGRDPSNAIALAHPQISRFHSQIQKRPDGWMLVDLHTTNGTFLNGKPIQHALLKVGDVIQISDFEFHFDGIKLDQESQEGRARIDAISLRRVVGAGQIILHDVSLSIHPREFVAIVGVSGAGKSTLMSALSGFRPADQGLVLVNEVDFYKNFDAFRSTLGYVPQDDIIHRELTVYRALFYAARLRMPEDTRKEEMDRRIEEVMRDLQLLERRDVAISRLSGGQRKRVSIGVELLTKPRLFYLDEPTSGLDPGLEAEMMQIFRKMADQGHTTILITHATKNLLLCDQVAFLAKGGYLAYYGPPQGALRYFKTDDFIDVYINLEREKTPEDWGREFKKSAEYQTHVEKRLNEIKRVESPQDAPAQAAARANPMGLVDGGSKRSSALLQLYVLTRRYVEIIMRDGRNLAILLAQAPLIGILLYFAYPANIFSPVEGDYGRAKSVLFFLCCISIWFGTSNSAREIAKEAPIWRRERTVNLGIAPYIFSKIVVLVVLAALQSGIMLAIVCLKVRFPPLGWIMYRDLFGVFMLVSTAGLTMGLMFSALVNNPDKAASLVPILLIPQIVFSGAMMPLEGASEWLSYGTLSKWGFELTGYITQIWRVPVLTYPRVRLAEETTFHILPAVHTWILVGYILFFVVSACLFQKLKDYQRD